MKIQIGSGRVRLPGFLNVDIRPVPETDVVGHAGDLHAFSDRSVEIVFSHAVLEHVFLAHQLIVVEEWRRILSETGLVVCLGLPDFRAIARLYLEGSRGVVGERFDLLNVYRYTHGEPEHSTDSAWTSWRPETHPDSAPSGWIPQLHKSLFDASYLGSLFDAGGFSAVVFNYIYQGEEHPLNLGAVAWTGGRPHSLSDVEIVRAGLARIPEVERWVVLDSIRIAPAREDAEGLLDYGKRLRARTPQRQSIVHRLGSSIGRAILTRRWLWGRGRASTLVGREVGRAQPPAASDSRCKGRG